MALRTPLSVTPHLYMGDSTGRPLDNGVVYFGEQDKDPEFYPITLYSDDALTKPLAQPVHTKGGYLYDKGDMVEPHAKELIYSVKVLDSYGRKVFYKGAMMRNSWNDDVIQQINTAIVGSADVARQVATDITNEAINNTAIEGGVLADTFVTMTKKAPDSVARSLRDVNSDSLDVKDFGAVEGGVVDSTSAFRLGILAAKSTERTLTASGTYLITDTLIIDYDVDFKAAVINYDGDASSALELRAADNSYVRRRSMVMPQLLVNKRKTAIGWLGDTTGITVSLLDSCRVTFGSIRGFSKNLRITAKAYKGTAYNEFHLGHLDNGKINLAIDNGDGWVNENNFYGGRFSQNSDEGSSVVGTRQISITMSGLTSTHVPNNNVFYKPSLEGNTSEYHYECQGTSNTILHGRWEASPPKVLYKKVEGSVSVAVQATRNLIDGGYSAQSIVVSTEGSGGSFRNELRANGRYVYPMTGSNSGHRFANGFSGSAGAISIYNNTFNTGTAALENAPDESYSVILRGDGIGVKSPANTHNVVDITSKGIDLSSGDSLVGVRLSYDRILGIRVDGGGIGCVSPQQLGNKAYPWKNLHLSESVGFWGGSAPTTKPVVTGSTSDGTALKSLLTALASYGLITDSST